MVGSCSAFRDEGNTMSEPGRKNRWAGLFIVYMEVKSGGRTTCGGDGGRN